MTGKPFGPADQQPSTSAGTACSKLVGSLDGGCAAAIAESLAERLGDLIDDRVAADFDELLARRLAAPGLLRRPSAADRATGLAVVCPSLALGALAAIADSLGAGALLITWVGLVLLNLVYFFRPRRHLPLLDLERHP